VSGPSSRSGPALRSRLSWPAAWPCYLFLAFAALALAAVVPGGPPRAIVAAPILLGVPGALTLGAVQARSSVDIVAFGGLAAVVSALWLAFAALLLTAVQIRITAGSAYACLLLACAVLAIVAQLRIHRGCRETTARERGSPAAVRPLAGASPRAATDVLSPPDEHSGSPARGARYALVAVVAGAALLAGAAYAYARAPHPAPDGYTWLAWTGQRTAGVITVGPGGRTLSFQIGHQRPGTAEFRLVAGWTGGGKQHALAPPRIVRLGAGQTIQASLAIPRPPGACAYRVVVTLTELGGAHRQTWSINADVRAGRHPSGQPGCAS
jgi:hypothetical protein